MNFFENNKFLGEFLSIKILSYLFFLSVCFRVKSTCILWKWLWAFHSTWMIYSFFTVCASWSSFLGKWWLLYVCFKQSVCFGFCGVFCMLFRQWNNYRFVCYKACSFKRILLWLTGFYLVSLAVFGKIWQNKTIQLRALPYVFCHEISFCALLSNVVSSLKLSLWVSTYSILSLLRPEIDCFSRLVF